MNYYKATNPMKAFNMAKLLIALAILIGAGQTAHARNLIGLDYSIMTGNALQLVLTFDEAAIEPVRIG